MLQGLPGCSIFVGVILVQDITQDIKEEVVAQQALIDWTIEQLEKYEFYSVRQDPHMVEVLAVAAGYIHDLNKIDTKKKYVRVVKALIEHLDIRWNDCAFSAIARLKNSAIYGKQPKLPNKKTAALIASVVCVAGVALGVVSTLSESYAKGARRNSLEQVNAEIEAQCVTPQHFTNATRAKAYLSMCNK